MALQERGDSDQILYVMAQVANNNCVICPGRTGVYYCANGKEHGCVYVWATMLLCPIFISSYLAMHLLCDLTSRLHWCSCRSGKIISGRASKSLFIVVIQVAEVCAIDAADMSQCFPVVRQHQCSRKAIIGVIMPQVS